VPVNPRRLQLFRALGADCRTRSWGGSPWHPAVSRAQAAPRQPAAASAGERFPYLRGLQRV